MRCLWIMFVTAVCFLFLLKLKWPKNKNIYEFLLYRVFVFFSQFVFNSVLFFSFPVLIHSISLEVLLGFARLRKIFRPEVEGRAGTYFMERLISTSFPGPFLMPISNTKWKARERGWPRLLHTGKDESAVRLFRVSQGSFRHVFCETFSHFIGY